MEALQVASDLKSAGLGLRGEQALVFFADYISESFFS